MAGHNKWSKIKRKKEVSDAKKSKEFSKLARLISIESKRVGGDVNSATLKTLIEKAKSINMPKDNIERAVEKGRSGNGEALESVTYEFFGPGGVAVIVEALTDNRNRTNQEVKHILSKHGYSLGTPGSASWAFTKTGLEWHPTMATELSEEDGEKLSEILDTLEDHDDVQEVFTNAA